MCVADLVTGYVETAVLTEDPIFGAEQPLFQRAGQRHQLEGGSRLEQVGDGPVASYLRPHLAERVRVVQWNVGHRQHLARPGVGHDGNPALSLELGHGRGEFFFQDRLVVSVDCQRHVGAILRELLHGTQGRQALPLCIHLGGHNARFALQQVVLCQLHAFDADVVNIRVPQHLTGKGLHRIAAPHLHHPADAFRQLLLRHTLRNLACEPDKGRVLLQPCQNARAALTSL